MTKHSLYLYILLIIAFVGCAEFGRRPAPPPTPAPLQHTIKYSGETLAAIASWYTGDSKNWKRIAEANNNIKPEALKIGMIIEVPMELVSKVEAPPQTHFRVRAKTPSQTTKTTPQPPTNTEDISTAPDVTIQQEQPTDIPTIATPTPQPTNQAITQPAQTLPTPNTTDELLEQLLKE